MRLTEKPDAMLVGVLSTEPMRVAGLLSAFETHATIRAVAGGLDELLREQSLVCLILDASHGAEWMGLQLRFKRARPEVKVLVVGSTEADEVMLRALLAGARGYVDAAAPVLAVRRAVETVLRGCIWAPRRVLSLLIDRLQMQVLSGSSQLASPVLSPRERQVLNLIMMACSNREIAEELGIEERTVKAYVASLLRKHGADNRVSLSVQATQDSMRVMRAGEVVETAPAD